MVSERQRNPKFVDTESLEKGAGLYDDYISKRISGLCGYFQGSAM